MPDIIGLLPDAVANQIAAGEVIQRPASAVKEMLENAVDAKATHIQLIIKDAGKALIQVIDNGLGMSETDARMSFERHATSKIKSADDLFALHTFGFRGEALASIAAVAQVRMRTRPHYSDLGTELEIEDSIVRIQQPCACPVGTNLALSNLFFNVPARRNFLKSNQIEMRHIQDEFTRVALSYPEIGFSLVSNDMPICTLKGGNLRQRIVALFGEPYNKHLVPVAEDTTLVRVGGFVCKPQLTRKSKAEQYFILNGRYIRDFYLANAIETAYKDLLPLDAHCAFFMTLEIDPRRIDVNVHPTKTEIKFTDQSAIYHILHSAVRRALAQFSVVPSIDFEQEQGVHTPPPSPPALGKLPQAPSITISPDYNPFSKPTKTSTSRHLDRFMELADPWQSPKAKLQKATLPIGTTLEAEQAQTALPESAQAIAPESITQIHNRYLLCPIKSGIILVDQHAAHQRILYEELLQQFKLERGGQNLLFPESVPLSANQRAAVQGSLLLLTGFGFDISLDDPKVVIIFALPPALKPSLAIGLLQDLADMHEATPTANFDALKQALAKRMANKAALKAGTPLNPDEASAIIHQLFACEMPYFAPNGKATLTTLTFEELAARFSHS